MSTPTLDINDVNTKIQYDEHTGEFTWRKSGTGRRKNLKAGSITNKGYITIKINQVVVQEHRLAWFIHYGSFPELDIDHINGDTTDNRICNLRCVTDSVNLQNTKKHRNGHLAGTSKLKSGKWRATARINNKKTHIGVYETAELAHEAFKMAMSGEIQITERNAESRED